MNPRSIAGVLSCNIMNQFKSLVSYEEGCSIFALFYFWKIQLVSFVGDWNSFFLLLVNMCPRTVLSLGPLNSDPARWHPGDADTSMGVTHHSDGNNNPYVTTCLGVPLDGKEAGQVFQSGLRLGAQKVAH